MDLVFRNARLAEARPGDPLVDIAVEGGRIAAIGPRLDIEGPEHDLAGALICAGLVECHLHLDKAHIFDRTAPETGRNADSVRRTSAAKHSFTVEDVHRRASKVLARAVVQGTTQIRTQLELDPIVDMRGFEGVTQAIRDFADLVDVEICVFPEEGLTNNPGTDELLVAALEKGVRVIGGAPGSDTDREGQLERIFELARAYECDIDLHIDFGNDPSELDLEPVLRLTERDKMGGRVAMAHVTKLSTLPLNKQKTIARRLADAGIAIAVLPATDTFLMGRDQTDNVRRGVVDGHMLIAQGMNAAVGTNNIVNAFTPFGDCSLVRLANFYAHIVQVSTDDDMRTLWEMVTTRAARMANLKDYGLVVGAPADLVVMDAADPIQAIREVRQPVMAFKRGRLTLNWPKPQLIGAPRLTAT